MEHHRLSARAASARRPSGHAAGGACGAAAAANDAGGTAAHLSACGVRGGTAVFLGVGRVGDALSCGEALTSVTGSKECCGAGAGMAGGGRAWALCGEGSECRDIAPCCSCCCDICGTGGVCGCDTTGWTSPCRADGDWGAFFGVKV